MPVVGAEELDAEAGDHWLAFRAAGRGQPFREVAREVERPVGDVDERRADADLLGYRVEEPPLGHRLVVADVVCLADRVLDVERQQQPLHDVGDVDEGQGVVTAADDDALPGPHAIRHPAEVQAITGTEERARPEYHRGQLVLGDHLLHGQVALGFGHRVRLAERLEHEILPRGPA